ncbi:MAG: GreA/GreB family elongation factor [Polyangiaceae bacterium]|nr:GreA/GreB family elongation factor [Polyangiaceae bacterium]
MSSACALFVTTTDQKRLAGVMARLQGRLAGEGSALREGMAAARIVASHEVPPDVVTMNSRLVLDDATTGELREVTLVYPWDADPDAGKESVFSPLGTVLLGRRIGRQVDWVENGAEHRACIAQIVFQPEAHGAFYL